MDTAALYRSLVEDSSDAIWVLDLDGRTVFANRALNHLYGGGQDPVAPSSVFDTLDEVGRDQFRLHLALVRTGERGGNEVEVLFHDRVGAKRWILVRESLLRDDEGRVVALSHRLIDYGERRADREALRASQERLQAIQEAARFETWVWLWSPGGPELDLLLARLHPRDRPRAEAAIRAALVPGGTLDLDIREPRADGWSWSRLRGRATLLTDGTWELLGSRQDVNDLLNAQRALRTESDQNRLVRVVASAANESESLVDVLARIRDLDRPYDRWERGVVLLVQEDGTLGHLMSTETDHRDASRERELAAQALHAPGTVWDQAEVTAAFAIRLKSEVQAVVVLSRASPPDDRARVELALSDVGVQLGYVAEREKARRELAAARDVAMSANRQKSTFLATMSHEVRTPLNGMLGLNELLLDSGLDTDQRKLVTGAQAAGRTLLRLINDVLDFSRIETGRLSLASIPFDLRDTIAQAVRVVEPARRAGVDLVVDIEDDVPAVLIGDQTKLAQLVTNLVSNALKFTEAGEVRVDVSVDTRAVTAPDPDPDPASPPKVPLLVEVSDTGIGIAPTDAERIFEPFEQLDASTTRRYGGTGLGLAIAREIAKAQGGELTHRPRPGGGSIFSFWTVNRFTTAGGSSEDTEATRWLAGKRMLLVGDWREARGTLLQLLTRWGVIVTEAEDATSALAELAKQVPSTGDGPGRPDATEPVGSMLIHLRGSQPGLALAQAVADVPAYDDVTMILIADSTLDVDAALAAGVSACLSRPVDIAQLRQVVLEQVGGLSVKAGPRPGAARRHRVLVVEDNDANQLVATRLLDSLGYRHAVASDGAQALDLIRLQDPDRPYDLVLMDIQMPVLDGYGATRALREWEGTAGTARLPVVAITASAIAGERERCLEAGMDDFMTKPIDLPGLARTLARWLTGGSETSAQEPGEPEPGAAAAHPSQPPEPLDRVRLQMLLDLDPGDTSYLDRAITNFTENSRQALLQIHAHLAAGEIWAIKPVSHKIAGSALNLGANRAGESARGLELACDAGVAAEVAPLVAELDEAMAQARDLLAEFWADHVDD